MKDDSIRFGCQTYTWQMSFAKYQGKLQHIISTIRAAGLAGIEPEVAMLGNFAKEPGKLHNCLQSHDVALGALCLVCDWRKARETPEERAQANAAIAMLRDYFPQSVLVLCQMPGADRRNLRARQKNALACVNAVAARAHAAGITSAFHPNSPAGSIFRTADDYTILLDGLDARSVGFAPDAGHIAKGGMDPVKVLRETLPLIRHVHFKDMDPAGQWQEMGRGGLDFQGMVDLLKQADYRGWIMIEDESASAEHDPDAVTLANGKYIREKFNSQE